jgi:S1-C subfamily serine protease
VWQTLHRASGFRRNPEVVLARIPFRIWARILGSFLATTLLACAAVPAFAQADILTNQQGATAPCVGFGPIAAPAVKKCASLFEQAGFILNSQLGYSGLTVATKGETDGAVTAIDPESPAVAAGFKVGDAVIAVNGKPVQPTPGMIAAKAVFGQRGDTLHMTLKRAGSKVDVSFVRAAENAPAGPTASGFMTSVKDMINWRGQFAPCIGIGPAGAAAIAFCNGHFKPYGFIKSSDFGSTGFQIDLANKSKALVTTVDPGSPASKAGVQPGDEIVAVEGQPLTASKGENANEMIFGKIGDEFKITVQRGQSVPTLNLVLAAKPKK